MPKIPLSATQSPYNHRKTCVYIVGTKLSVVPAAVGFCQDCHFSPVFSVAFLDSISRFTVERELSGWGTSGLIFDVLPMIWFWLNQARTFNVWRSGL